MAGKPRIAIYLYWILSVIPWSWLHPFYQRTPAPYCVFPLTPCYTASKVNRKLGNKQKMYTNNVSVLKGTWIKDYKKGINLCMFKLNKCELLICEPFCSLFHMCNMINRYIFNSRKQIKLCHFFLVMLYSYFDQQFSPPFPQCGRAHEAVFVWRLLPFPVGQSLCSQYTHCLDSAQCALLLGSHLTVHSAQRTVYIVQYTVNI